MELIRQWPRLLTAVLKCKMSLREGEATEAVSFSFFLLCFFVAIFDFFSVSSAFRLSEADVSVSAVRNTG